MLCGEREQTEAIIYHSGDPVGDELGGSAQQHCPLLVKQGTVCLPQSQVKAFLQDTEIFHSKKKTTQTKIEQKWSGEVNAFVSRRLTTVSPTVRRPDVLTKKPLDSVFL